ncbi:response regulator transcription factor [Paenibacillus sp. LHD-117]|uniref:response regulator transcription factor n=1 Tax=Paenibacillus sp. LHD-117 TaxID=3071412 RepID=UPI0027E13133|nr:response regulator transcription factor [Paenibacillus sp. LHD-117]MDQ6418727.1 response regulator transcription factor [Paenibacillus sp. LHD-117]
MYKVFLTDDEPFILEGLRDALDWSSYELEIVGTAENGLRALDKLRATHADILITDISMPAMNGLELIREARRINRELHVVILSGFNDFDYLKQGMRLGIENYLLKPINLQELKATLEGIIEKLDRRGRDAGEWLQEDIGVLRDNIVNRWLNGEIGPGELHERAEMLGLELDREYVQIVLAKGTSNEEKLRLELYRLAERDGFGIPFRDREGAAGVVMFPEGEQAGGTAARRLLERLRESLPDESITISAGDVVAGEDQVGRSYAQAKKAMEFAFIHPKLELLEYGALANNRLSADKSLSLDWGDYARLLAAKEKVRLLARIDEDFARLAEAQGMTPSRLQSAALELMLHLKLELGAIKKTAEPELIREDAALRVMGAESLDGMTAVVKEVAETAVESLVSDTKSPVIGQILAKIHENCAEELSLKSLSAQYNIHPVYLGRLFQKETGESFSEYLNRYRIEKAKELLADSRLKVNEIARMVGYWEMGYFYKQFKKQVGVSPTDYKALLQA